MRKMALTLTGLVVAFAAACSSPGSERVVPTTSGVISADPRDESIAMYDGVPLVIGDTALRFPSGAMFTPGFFGVEYIGVLDSENSPFVLVSGFECNDCDANRSVLVRSVKADPLPNVYSGPIPGHFAYPGRVTHYDTGALLTDTRLFYGRCMQGSGPVIVQFATEWTFARESDTAGVREEVVNIAEVAGDSLIARVAFPTRAALETTLALVAARQCHEIIPKPQLSEP